jgi:hypothetical protein
MPGTKVAVAVAVAAGGAFFDGAAGLSSFFEQPIKINKAKTNTKTIDKTNFFIQFLLF